MKAKVLLHFCLLRLGDAGGGAHFFEERNRSLSNIRLRRLLLRLDRSLGGRSLGGRSLGGRSLGGRSICDQRRDKIVTRSGLNRLHRLLRATRLLRFLLRGLRLRIGNLSGLGRTPLLDDLVFELVFSDNNAHISGRLLGLIAGDVELVHNPRVTDHLLSAHGVFHTACIHAIFHRSVRRFPVVLRGVAVAGLAEFALRRRVGALREEVVVQPNCLAAV